MSFFQNLKILLKKHYIITSSASACAISATLPLCFSILFLVIRDCEHYAADCIFANEGAKDRAKVGEAVFMDSWLVVFRGCF
jgi:hypothetical protein